MKLKRNDVEAYVTEVVWQHDLSYMDAVIYIVENDGVDMEEISCHIKKIPALLKLIEEEAEGQRAFVKSANWFIEQASKDAKKNERREKRLANK